MAAVGVVTTSAGGAGSAGGDRIAVLVVDDDPLVRQALAMILDGLSDVVLVGEARDGDEVPEQVEARRPDVILMDIRMPRVDGLRATAAVRALPAAPQVIVLTTFHAGEEVVDAVEAGASGFLLKDSPPAEIVAAVRRVAEGDAVLSPSVTRRLLDRVSSSLSGRPREDGCRARQQLAELPERERQVAMAVGRGLSNADIGSELCLSVATVKAHVSRLLAKLALDNRVQIALLARDAASPD